MLTFLAVSVLWLLFRADSIGQWKEILCNILSFSNTQISDGLISALSVPYGDIFEMLLHLGYFTAHIRGFWVLLFYAFALILCLSFENVYKREYKNNAFTALASAVLLIFTVTCIGGESVFVYFNF